MSTDLLAPVTPKAIGGYAYMAKYTDHHSRLRAASFIEKPPPVLPTAYSATSQVKARQLALQCQYSLKEQFEAVSQYTRAVGMDELSPLASVSVPNTYAQTMACHKRKNANLQRPLFEGQRLQHGELLLRPNTLKSQLQLRLARPTLTIAAVL